MDWHHQHQTNHGNAAEDPEQRERQNWRSSAHYHQPRSLSRWNTTAKKRIPNPICHHGGKRLLGFRLKGSSFIYYSDGWRIGASSCPRAAPTIFGSPDRRDGFGPVNRAELIHPRATEARQAPNMSRPGTNSAIQLLEEKSGFKERTVGNAISVGCA